MPRTKNWVWDHFHQGTERANSTHWKALCKFCTDQKLKDLLEAEEKTLRLGLRDVARSKDILIIEGM